jgi:hypothetical protein
VTVAFGGMKGDFSVAGKFLIPICFCVMILNDAWMEVNGQSIYC